MKKTRQGGIPPVQEQELKDNQKYRNNLLPRRMPRPNYETNPGR